MKIVGATVGVCFGIGEMSRGVESGKSFVTLVESMFFFWLQR